MIERIAEYCIERRAWVVGIIGLLTLVLSWFAVHVDVRSCGTLIHRRRSMHCSAERAFDACEFASRRACQGP